jgi:hypothetical protein
MLDRLNAIERKYGAVALAATMFLLAIAVHGAFAVGSLQQHAALDDSGSNVAAHLSPGDTPLGFDDGDPLVATVSGHRDTSFAREPEQPAASATSAAVATVPAEPVQAMRESATTQSTPAGNARPRDTVAKTATTDQSAQITEPSRSALAANQGDRLAPLGISAVAGNALSDQPDSATSAQPAISAVAR